MDELNPTIKERQIYHEMKLTPAMVKSIRTLCVATTTLSCRAESGFHSPAGMR